MYRSRRREPVLEVPLGSDPQPRRALAGLVGNLHFPIEVAERQRPGGGRSRAPSALRAGALARACVQAGLPAARAAGTHTITTDGRRSRAGSLFCCRQRTRSFPTGAYAHSLGFEEAVRLGMVRDEALARRIPGARHIFPALSEAGTALSALCMAAAADAISTNSARRPREISAWKLARETREASLQLGGRRLTGAA